MPIANCAFKEKEGCCHLQYISFNILASQALLARGMSSSGVKDCQSLKVKIEHRVVGTLRLVFSCVQSCDRGKELLYDENNLYQRLGCAAAHTLDMLRDAGKMLLPPIIAFLPSCQPPPCHNHQQNFMIFSLDLLVREDLQ